MKSSPSFFAVVLFSILFSLFSQAAWSQEFTSIERELSELESLISDTLENSAEQQRQLEDLRKNLAESGELLGNYESIIAGQESLLEDLQTHLDEMSETYRTQSALSAKYERSSRFWKTFTLIAVPAAALLSGGLVWALK
jgi:predicted  nucleic acid-binding Zn-ribbon protein